MTTYNVFAYITLYVLLRETSGVEIKTKICPCNESEWKMRERTFSCESGKVYSCLLNKEGNLVETCLLNYTFPPTKVGCPFLLENPYIDAKHTPCNSVGCPSVGHLPFTVREMYKYPICWVPEKERLLSLFHPRLCKKSSTLTNAEGGRLAINVYTLISLSLSLILPIPFLRWGLY